MNCNGGFSESKLFCFDNNLCEKLFLIQVQAGHYAYCIINICLNQSLNMLINVLIFVCVFEAMYILFWAFAWNFRVNIENNDCNLICSDRQGLQLPKCLFFLPSGSTCQACGANISKYFVLPSVLGRCIILL